MKYISMLNGTEANEVANPFTGKLLRGTIIFCCEHECKLELDFTATCELIVSRISKL